jgi:hypothetical protein
MRKTVKNFGPDNLAQSIADLEELQRAINIPELGRASPGACCMHFVA